MTATLPLTPGARGVQVTPHFAWREFAVSAEHPALVRAVPAALEPNVRALATAILEPLRADVGPLVVLSGFRPEALNTAVGGSPTSQHLRADAADLRPVRITAEALFRHLLTRMPLLPTGQVIYYPDRGFVHVARPSRTYPVPTFCVHQPRRDLVYRMVLTTTQLDLFLGRS